MREPTSALQRAITAAQKQADTMRRANTTDTKFNEMKRLGSHEDPDPELKVHHIQAHTAACPCGQGLATKLLRKGTGPYAVVCDQCIDEVAQSLK